MTAYHEAGHVFAAVWLGATVRSASIDPDRDDGPNRMGEAVVLWNRARFTAEELARRSAMVALAGPVAEMIYRDEVFHPAGIAEWRGDWVAAMQSLDPMPSHRRTACLEKATLDLHLAFSRDDFWAAIAAIADSLQAHEILDQEMIEDAVEPWLPAD